MKMTKRIYAGILTILIAVLHGCAAGQKNEQPPNILFAFTDDQSMIHAGAYGTSVSGYTDGMVSHRGFLQPDTPFLQKPFSLDTLAGKVSEVLEEKSA